MQDKRPEPPAEQSLYEFLGKLLDQRRDNADNVGLVAYVATLGFLAFIFIVFVTLTIVGVVQ